MTVEQLKFLLDTYGYDCLLFVINNNGKRITLTKEERDNKVLKFDHDKELMIYNERYHGADILHAMPYSFIEDLVFKVGAQATFENDPNRPGLLLDEKTGKPIVRQPNEW